MKKIGLRIISAIFGIIAIVAVGFTMAVNYGSSGGFLDLRNFARMIYSGVAIICSSLSVITWKVDDKADRKKKVVVWISIVAVIIIATMISALYRVPAVEIVN